VRLFARSPMQKVGTDHAPHETDVCPTLSSITAIFHAIVRLLYIMNWTGGSLQRTKHASKGIVQKQKAHFARARTHHQGGAKSPAVPFRPSYLGFDNSFELSSHLPSYEKGSVRHTGHTARRRHAPTQRVHSPDDHTVHTDHRATTILEAASPKPLRDGAFVLRQAECGPTGILASLSVKLAANVCATQSADILTPLHRFPISETKSRRHRRRDSTPRSK
jgi:hypothetical protein